MSSIRLIAIALLCLCRAAAADDALRAHYTFDQGSGTILIDKSGHGNDARVLGPVWVKSGNETALDFTTAETVDCGDSIGIQPSGSITLVVWFRTISEAQQFLVSYYGWNIYLASGRTPILENMLNGGRWFSMGALSKVPLNEWASIGIVYDVDREIQEIYVNGELSNSMPRTQRPWRPGQHFRSKVVLGGRGFSGLMGEFRLYTRALSQAEMKDLYTASAKDRKLQPSAYRFAMTPHLFFRDKEVAVHVSLIGPRGPNPPQEEIITALAKVELRAKDAATALQHRTIEKLAETKTAEVHFSLTDLEPGTYEVRATIGPPGGEPIAADSAWVTLPETPSWFGGQAGLGGLEEQVFPPWTPLKMTMTADGATVVSCWGRSHRYSTGPFPDQIVTTNRELLAGPIRIRGIVDGRRIMWTSEPLQVRKESPAQITFLQRATDPAMELRVETTIDYDGMVRADCTLVPLRPATLRQLVIEIPFRREIAKLQYQCRDALFKAPSAVPEAGIVRPFNPAIWLGDEDGGLQWFTDSDQYWHLADPARAIEMMPEDDLVMLRLNLVTKPLEMKPGQSPALTYTIGLQATPIKSIEKDQWDYRWSGAHRYGGDYAMLTESLDGKPVLDRYVELGMRTLLLGNWTDAMSYPQPFRHEKEFRQLVEAMHQRGMKAVVYFGAQFSELAPEFEGFKEDFVGWGTERPYSYSSYPDNYPGMPTQTVYGPCVRSDWKEFMLAGAARLMDEYDVDGVYFDNTGAIMGGCMNPRHPGCGALTRPDGSTTRAVSIFEGRDFMRRLYQIIKSRKPDGVIDLHPASFVVAPIMAWSTGTFDGETILGEDRRGANPSKDDPILSYLPLDGFRAQLMGHNWGVPSEFIDTYVPIPKHRQFALTLLHDVPIRTRSVTQIWQAFDKFDRHGAQWFPYWRNSELVSVQPADCYVSLYKHPQNGVLAVVSNLGTARAKIEIAFELDKLGLPGECKAVDAVTGDPVSLQNGKLAIELDSVDWQLVWLH